MYSERVIRFKFSFLCSKCGELNTLFEDEINQAEYCQICEKKINARELIKGANKGISLDYDNFIEYINEEYGGLIDNIKESNSNHSNKNIIPFTKVKDNIKLEEVKQMKKEIKLFISHAELDKEYAKSFVEFLEDIGMGTESIFCSSLDGYGIPWGSDIYDYIANEFSDPNKELLVLFMLSNNYYSSAASLNEMGAAWIKKKEYRSILLPGFEFKEIKGAINPSRIAIKLDDINIMSKLNEIQKQLSQLFNLSPIEPSRWDRVRKNFIDSLKK